MVFLAKFNRIIKMVFFTLLLMGGASSFGQVTIKDIVPGKVKTFPCMECHVDMKSKKAVFPLDYPHQKLKFKHYQGIKNCYNCHNPKNLNELKLINGQKVSFNEAYKLCIQCHAEKGREWKLGIHGLQIGQLKGEKTRYSCRHCHKSHRPKFRRMTADPPPKYPNLKRFFKPRKLHEQRE